MRISYKLTAAGMILFAIICTLAVGSQYRISIVAAKMRNDGPSPTPAQTANSWLKGTTDEKLAQIEKHLRGLDVAMAEIGYRYGELHTAAKTRNWDYAKYQTEKVDLALKLALERRPQRAASAEPFINEALPNVMKAIQARDAAQMDRAMEQLHNSCIECHRRENVLHFRESVERIRKNARTEK